MPRALNIKFADLDETFEPKVVEAESDASNRISIVSSASHARHLQNMLAEAYEVQPAADKLPVWQRAAVILTANLMLWAIIATFIYLIFF